MKVRERQSPHEASPGNELGGDVPGDDTAADSAPKRLGIVSNKVRIDPVDEVRLLRAAACDWRLSRGDVGVLATILRHADDSWLAFPGTRTISEMARLAASNVIASIGKLERLGYLRVTRRGQRKRQDFQVLASPELLESAPARRSSGFGQSASAHRSSQESASAPVDRNPSAPVDRENLLLSIGAEGTYEDTIEDTKRARVRKSTAIVLPTWLPAEAWEDWKAHRGKSFSRRAQALAIGKLQTLHGEGHDPRKLIDLAIESGWSSFYPREQTLTNPKTKAPVGAIERDHRSEAEIERANEEQMARFGLGGVA